MAETSTDKHVSILARSLRLGSVATTRVDFMLGSLDAAHGSMTSSIWFGPQRNEEGLRVVAHIQVDAPGDAEGRPRVSRDVSEEDTIFVAHVHVEGQWVPKDQEHDIEASLADEEALRLFAETSGRLNLYPYLRVTVTELCARSGLDVPPLPPMTFDLPS